MWKVVYIASTESEALKIEEKLNAADFLIDLNTMGDGSIQIKVPESEANEAYDFIATNL